MDAAAFGIKPFSTDVDLWLEGSWGRWPLSQVGDTFIISQKDGELPPTRGQVVVSVDGHEFRHPVRLPNGIQASEVKIAITPDDGIPF